MENLESIDFHIQYVTLRLEEFAALLAFLEERRKNMMAIQKRHEVSAQLQTEQLMEKMKSDRNHS